ncbi:MAG: hypothetical protein AB1547_08905, partial [Thermodesulfobacteriota bacterium]
IQRYPAASNTFSQQSQKASPATPLMPDIYEKHGKIDFLRGHQTMMKEQPVRCSQFTRPPAGGPTISQIGIEATVCDLIRKENHLADILS